MNQPSMTVEAYAGYKGEETPRALTLDGVRIEVRKVVDRWYTETHSCFRVKGSDEQHYVLRYDLDDAVWELVMQERSPKNK